MKNAAAPKLEDIRMSSQYKAGDQERVLETQADEDIRK
jgi:hypothetical protein